MNKTVLLTGFEPFGGAQVNPSMLAAQALDGRSIAGHRIVSAVLPCRFGAARTALSRELRRVRPSLVICTGQGARGEIAVERVAINLDDARIADNAGKQPSERPIVRGAPTAYWSSLPVKEIALALRRARIPAEVSCSAGTFVCNHVFYGLMRSLARKPRVRGGFVHVPPLPEQNAELGMELAKIVRAIEIAITTSLAR